MAPILVIGSGRLLSGAQVDAYRGFVSTGMNQVDAAEWASRIPSRGVENASPSTVEHQPYAEAPVAPRSTVWARLRASLGF